MSQPAPAAAAAASPDLDIDALKLRAGVACEVATISTYDKSVRVIFVGTAHVSKESPKDVQRLIDEFVRGSGQPPLAIAVELCKQRQHLYSSPQPVAQVDTDAFALVEIRKLIDQQISRGVAPSVAVVTSILSYFYSWTSSKVGSGVGQEFVAAYHAAEALAGRGFNVADDFLCCDRMVNITLQRLMRKLSLWELYKLAFSLVAGVLLVDEDDLKLIEQMRTNGGDMLTVAMRQFATEYPVAANVLIDERNEWMASYLWLQCDSRPRSTRDTVFVIAGAAHLPGLIDAALKLWPKSHEDKAAKRQEMQQRLSDLQLVPAHSNVPTFMRTLPLALLACSGAVWVAMRSVRSHWVNHGAAKTAAAGLLAYAGWRSFRFVRKRKSSELLDRLEPLLTFSVIYGIVKGAAAVARKALAGRV